MAEKQSGFAWHCHHDVLIEWVTDFQKRVDFIKEQKPIKERTLRLKLFRMIPEHRLPKGLIKAREVYDKAREAYDKAWEAYFKAWEAYDKAREAYDKAREACDKAREACDKAWEAYDKALETSKAEISKLHDELCPNCTWNGKTIFANKDGE